MNTITLVLVLVLHSGGAIQMSYGNGFNTAEDCTKHALDAGAKFAAKEEVKRVKYYCIKTAEEI